jgi:hypothetical protein
MYKTFLTNWNFSRLFRLSLGVLVLVQAIMSKDTLLVFFSLLFVAMPVFNIGCCSTGNCATTAKKASGEEIDFEEIK